MKYKDQLAGATVAQLRINAAAAGIAGRSKMNKAELVEAVAAAWTQVIEFAHADAIVLDEKRTMARAFLSTPSGARLTDNEIEAALQARKGSNERLLQLGLLPTNLCDHGIDLRRICSICLEDEQGNQVTPAGSEVEEDTAKGVISKLTDAQLRAMKNVFADSVGVVRIDVAFCRPQVFEALGLLGLTRRASYAISDLGLRVVAALNVTPRTNIYDRSDLSWLGDGAYVDVRQS
jgi:hypothetical protein